MVDVLDAQAIAASLLTAVMSDSHSSRFSLTLNDEAIGVDRVFAIDGLAPPGPGLRPVRPRGLKGIDRTMVMQ